METANAVTAPDYEAIAGNLYTVYCKAVGGRAWDGNPLPDWNTFRNDATKRVQSEAWIAVAKESVASK